MKRLALTSLSIRFPKTIVGLTLAGIVFAALQFPKVAFDNDPENMLAKDEYIRVFHNQVKAKFNLYDFVIVGIVNEKDPDGVFNVGTLGRIDRLTRDLESLRRGADGQPEVVRGGVPFAPQLEPASAWKRTLAKVFRHDANNLFDADGNSAIIAREIISPSVVDNIKQAARGQLKIEYLMEKPPTTRAEALAIRDDAMTNPLYKDTLVSADGKAVALYIPLIAKTYSYNVANLVEKLTANWPADDQVFITGQPVAQDTFGVEMLMQMATSAPLAGLAIFLLLLFFFRRVSLIIAPMLVAVVSVIATMGLLIGCGYEVHIMSSMIAIFLMPISVADSVHILSEFFDSYHLYRDKAKTVKHVIGHLFMPMLYTSLTTIAGFASLGTTPIPPVRVFGLFVAFGVALAWVLTMAFVPAYIMLFVRTRTLDRLKPDTQEHSHGALGKALARLGDFSYLRWKAILGITLAVVAISIYGITKIQVNDNPIKWFTKNHRIRVADHVLNAHFGGTYTAYLTLKQKSLDLPTCPERVAMLRKTAVARFGKVLPDATQDFLHMIDQADHTDEDRCFADLSEQAAKLDEKTTGAWSALGDAINLLDPQGLTREKLAAAIDSAHAGPDVAALLGQLDPALSGAALQEKALEICDSYSALSFRDFLIEERANMDAPTFKRPEMLDYVARLQAFLQSIPVVGKTSSAVDALKKANYELNYDVHAPAGRNQSFFSVPPTPSAVAQVFAQLEGMKKKDSLFHLVTRDYNEINLWVQLKSGDNIDMQTVVRDLDHWMRDNPPPKALDTGWAGLTYLNVVWQEKMVEGMLYGSLLSSFLVVLVMMMVLFRSPLYGILSMIPLSVTILFIYGLIGLIGKDYDMPVAVLSSMTLGLSVDFAIHFLERARELVKKHGGWKNAIGYMFQEPAIAISRNAIIISIGFTPLLFAPLVPYKTVGVFLATIMAVSWLATLFILAALVTGLQRFLFKRETTKED